MRKKIEKFRKELLYKNVLKHEKVIGTKHRIYTELINVIEQDVQEITKLSPKIYKKISKKKITNRLQIGT